MAKAKTSEAMPAVTRTAHQIHGAIAYYRDYPLELYYHRAIAAQAAYGDAGHHRRTLARLLREDSGVSEGTVHMTYQFITSEQGDDGIVVVTINDPDAKNAVNGS